MKFLIILCFILSSFAFASDEFSVDYVDDGWVLFIKQFESEKLMIRFPSDPLVESHKNEIWLSSSKDGVDYIFVRKIFENEIDPEKALGEILNNVKGSQLLGCSLKKEAYRSVIDLAYQRESLVYKTKFLLFNKCAYLFFTAHQKEKGDSYDYFVNSFLLKKF